MKGVILAGGTGSRLLPMTRVINKHLLPVGRYPMICYPLARLKSASITQVIIVTGKTCVGQIAGFLGSGAEFGLRLTYGVQEEATGIAAALAQAEDFVGSSRAVVILGDNVFDADLHPHLDAFVGQPSGAKVLLKEVGNPHAYGIAVLAGDRLVGIEEKPSEPKSRLCVTGIYLYDALVFEIIRSLQPSARGELEITDVNLAYLARGELTYDLLPGTWIDAGTFSSLAAANELMRDINHLF